MGSVSALFILKTLRLTFHILLPLELQLLTLGDLSVIGNCQIGF